MASVADTALNHHSLTHSTIEMLFLRKENMETCRSGLEVDIDGEERY